MPYPGICIDNFGIQIQLSPSCFFQWAINLFHCYVWPERLIINSVIESPCLEGEKKKETPTGFAMLKKF